MRYTNEHIDQQIEAYLNQDMSDLERAKFERMMHDDPELREEVEMQEATIEAIRQERMLLLKSGLSQVNVSLWSTGLVQMAKVAALAVGMGVASVGAYYLYMEDDSRPAQNINVVEATTPLPDQLVNESQVNSSEADLKLESQPGPDQNLTEKVPFESAPGNGEAPVSALKASSKTVAQGPNRLAAEEIKSQKENSDPAPVTEAIEPQTKWVQPLTGKDTPLPIDGISNRSSLESIHPEVVFKRDNKNIFHYQFSENKLVLYADFSDKLYEVLELNQDNTKRMFFYYDNHFYSLDPAQVEIAPLKQVEDKGLIQVLTTYLKRKN